MTPVTRVTASSHRRPALVTARGPDSGRAPAEQVRTRRCSPKAPEQAPPAARRPIVSNDTLADGSPGARQSVRACSRPSQISRALTNQCNSVELIEPSLSFRGETVARTISGAATTAGRLHKLDRT